jgi:long-chain fatty acid transport protein
VTRSRPGAAPLACLAWAALALPCASARADDTHYQDYPVGSRAMALGGAYAALADDPSGLTYNPAGICDTRQINVDVSASLYGLERQGQGQLQLAQGNFSLATLSTLNVIPGEAGVVKSFGTLDDVGAPFAIGFDVTVPSFRTYGQDTTAPTRLTTRVVDRTFDVAAGAAFRYDERVNLGFGLHFVLRQFSDVEDALITDGQPDPKVGVYHASGSFSTAGLVLVAGTKVHFDDGWLGGFSVGLPGVQVYSSGAVSIQDVVTDPSRPPPHTTVTTTDTSGVGSSDSEPLVLRLGVAKVRAHRWTLSGQATFHAGTSYDRFQLPPEVQARLRLQTHVDRNPVLDLNLGGELLLRPDVSLALGLFTDRTSAPELVALADGTIKPGTSRLSHIDVYGGTATLGLIGRHSITRAGLSFGYGSGEDAVASDPSGILDAQGYTRASVKQLFLYLFLASTFRY